MVWCGAIYIYKDYSMAWYGLYKRFEYGTALLYMILYLLHHLVWLGAITGVKGYGVNSYSMAPLYGMVVNYGCMALPLCWLSSLAAWYGALCHYAY